MSSLASHIQSTSAPTPRQTQNDELFRLSGLPQFLVDVSDTGALVFAGINPAHEALSGLRNADIAGRSPQECLPPAVARTISANYTRCVETADIYAYDEVLTLPNGERWYRTTLTPQKDHDGRVVRIFGQALDITDLMQESTLKSQSIANLENVVQDYSRMVPLIAHDFRGPMGEIGLALNLILNDFMDLGDGKRELLAAAHKTVAEVSQQFEDVLAFCAAISVDRPSYKRACSLAKLASDLVGVVDPAGSVEVTYPDHLLLCDQAELQITLRNLLSNACKFAASRVSINVTPGDADGFVRLVICDDGAGFARDAHAKGPEGTAPVDLAPVDPAPVDPAPVDLTTGHGFGLLAVQHLVRRAGGGLTIGRCPDLGGARVSLDLLGTLV